MVYITAPDGTEKKFACAKCIKGHRSSKCIHKDRELFEIKRKGRPVSQCDNCRLLRKTKQVHIKCICHIKNSVDDLKDFNTNIPSSSKCTSASAEDHPSAVEDQVHIFSECSVVNVNNQTSTLNSCSQCDRPKLYCICMNDMNTTLKLKHESLSSCSSDGSLTPPVYQSSYLNSSIPTANTATSAGLNINTSIVYNNQNIIDHADHFIQNYSTTTSFSNTPVNTNTPINITTPITSLPGSPLTTSTTSPISHNKPFPRLSIPIHDPSDDIDSDTPIYKSVDEADTQSVLGEFTSKSSDELMSQIYSGFDPSHSSPSSPLLREDDDQLVEFSNDS